MNIKEKRFQKAVERAVGNEKLTNWMYSMYDKYGKNFKGWANSPSTSVILYATKGIIKAGTSNFNYYKYLITKNNVGKITELVILRSNGTKVSIIDGLTEGLKTQSDLEFEISTGGNLEDSSAIMVYVRDASNITIQLPYLSTIYPYNVDYSLRYPNVLLPNTSGLSVGLSSVTFTSDTIDSSRYNYYKSSRSLSGDFVVVFNVTRVSGSGNPDMYFGLSSNLDCTSNSGSNPLVNNIKGIFFKTTAAGRAIEFTNDGGFTYSQTMTGSAVPTKVFIACMNNRVYFGTSLNNADITEASLVGSEAYFARGVPRYLSIFLKNNGVSTTLFTCTTSDN